MGGRTNRDSNTKDLMRDAAKAKVEPHLKHLINELIDLYRYSKIAQKQTIEKAINDLSDKNIKNKISRFKHMRKCLKKKGATTAKRKNEHNSHE